jgi:hypothetical protein
LPKLISGELDVSEMDIKIPEETEVQLDNNPKKIKALMTVKKAKRK